MKYNSEMHHRQSIRWKEHDYSSEGIYFITICSSERKHLFGTIEDGVVQLNDLGVEVWRCWQLIPLRFPAVIHEFVIMPNHLHAIVEIKEDEDTHAPIQYGTVSLLGKIIRGFKSAVSKYAGGTVWQSNYHDHVIRDVKEYSLIAEYIQNNPLQWEMDCYHSM